MTQPRAGGDSREEEETSRGLWDGQPFTHLKLKELGNNPTKGREKSRRKIKNGAAWKNGQGNGAELHWGNLGGWLGICLAWKVHERAMGLGAPQVYSPLMLLQRVPRYRGQNLSSAHGHTSPHQVFGAGEKANVADADNSKPHAVLCCVPGKNRKYRQNGKEKKKKPLTLLLLLSSHTLR